MKSYWTPYPQVHRARLLDGREVAMKVQYPGVAESIESDVDNLLRLMKYMNVFPKARFFLDFCYFFFEMCAIVFILRTEERSLRYVGVWHFFI